ncbi:MAG: nucleoside-diphosphate kinase [Treponema sp.]|jgi:nucleoside diphosphate kinase|nr:nucleoside-diphosphate kinase [Treponema sp.]
METISYVMVTPYTIAKSRTGGVIARLLSRLDLELVGAQTVALDAAAVEEYASLIKKQGDPDKTKGSELLADYVKQHFVPSEGRKHRALLLVFRGEDPCRKLADICGALFAQNQSIESITGETIRDTYADLITSSEDPRRVTYFEPAVLTPRRQAAADENLAMFARFLKGKDNIVQNMAYPDPSKIEQTLVIIKPDNWAYASSRPGTIIDMFSRTGLRIIGIKVHRFSLAEALEFYGPVEKALKEKLAPDFGRKVKEYIEKEFDLPLNGAIEKVLTEHVGITYAENQFRRIIEFMSGRDPGTCPLEELHNPGSVKCMLLIYEGENAVSKIRTVLGPTDPLKAPGGTVRREFGSNVMVNTAHASDSAENAKREMDIIKIHENSVADIINSYLALRKQ